MDRKKRLLSVACKILDILNGYGIDDNEINYLLKYDEADQDIGCLADDIRIEFDVESSE